jgi:hypothetical protein
MYYFLFILVAEGLRLICERLRRGVRAFASP